MLGSGGPSHACCLRLDRDATYRADVLRRSEAHTITTHNAAANMHNCTTIRTKGCVASSLAPLAARCGAERDEVSALFEREPAPVADWIRAAQFLIRMCSTPHLARGVASHPIEARMRCPHRPPKTERTPTHTTSRGDRAAARGGSCRI